MLKNILGGQETNYLTVISYFLKKFKSTLKTAESINKSGIAVLVFTISGKQRFQQRHKWKDETIFGLFTFYNLYVRQ